MITNENKREYMNVNLLGWVLIIFVVIICIKIYRESDTFNLKCIISDVDGNTYCVRERSKLTLVRVVIQRKYLTLRSLYTI